MVSGTSRRWKHPSWWQTSSSRPSQHERPPGGGRRSVPDDEGLTYPELEVGDPPRPYHRTVADHVLLHGRLADGGALAVQVAGGRPAGDTPFRLDVVGTDAVLTLTGGAPRGFQAGLLRIELDGQPVAVDDPETAGLPDPVVKVARLCTALRDDIASGTWTAPGLDHACAWRTGSSSRRGCATAPSFEVPEDPGVDVRDLEHFITVAEELHFARAAARLHIVPAAVSQRVRDLEAELGVRLFERTSRRVVLTPAGRLLLGPARTVLADLAAVSELARSLVNGASGQARLGLAPNLGDFGARFIAEVVSVLPELEAVGHSLWSVQALEALESGEVDAAIVRGPVAREGVTTVPVGTYRDGYVAVSEHDRAAGAETASVELFQGRPLLVPERALAPVVHDGTVAFFAEHGVAPLWRHHRLQSYEQMMTFVAAGYAAGLVHSHVADTEFPGVRIVPLVQTPPSFEVLVTWRTDDTSPAVARIAAVAEQMAREHDRARSSP